MQALSPTIALQKSDAVFHRNLTKPRPVRAACRVGLIVCLVALGAAAISTGRAAQPLHNNFICAQGPLCSGGWQSRDDRDRGQVVLHFTVAEGTPDGNYGWSYLADGISGGSYSVTVQNGVVTNIQDWVIWHTPDYFWGPQTIGVVQVWGSAHVRVASPSITPGFYPVDGYHSCCCDYGCTNTVTYTDTVQMVIGEGPAADENQTEECSLKTGCTDCAGKPMAAYSIHLLLASLHIEDTPVSYNSPRGPSTAFKVVYNQREANQPATFSYSNLGPKWTFNWLSYVTDNGPSVPPANPPVYARGGGTEQFSGYNSSTQSYTPDRQTLAVLVWMGDGTYEKRFPDGSKEVFGQRDDSTSPPRVFLTKVFDAAGNSATLKYDDLSRIIYITDSIGQSTSLEYDQKGDQWKITTVTDPFGRSAHFEYKGDNDQLSKITDPIGIESQFEYEPGTDFIRQMTTPYGSTTFATGEIGTSVRWLEATDPQGGKERVEYNEAAPNIPAAEASAPPGVYNSNLQFRNTFYWSKMAMSQAPGDYSKAEQFHWLATPDGKISGIKHSEKKALESRVWYTYEDQADPAKVGKNALPINVARIITGGATELTQYSYNALGSLRSETDPAGRVKSYLYATNNTDILAIYQRNPAGASVDPFGQNADKIAAYTYNSLHKPLTETDAAGQVTTYTYNTSGEILTRKNAKDEITTYVYGDGGAVPVGYLASITSPPFNNVSAVTTFGYDGAHRVRTVTNQADQFTVTTDYDDIDRKTVVTYPDGTYESFQYTDNLTGAMTLDLTASQDRLGRWTYRHYNGNRQMDSITDPLGHTTYYNWCTCGSLTSLTDPNGNYTMFNRDLQGRVYQRYNTDTSTVSYLYEGQTALEGVGLTSRLASSTVGIGFGVGRRTSYSYFVDGNISSISYADTPGAPSNPPTPPASYTYDPYHNRVATMTDTTGLTTYQYNSIPSAATLGAGKLHAIDGPLGDDTITFGYDELGRVTNQGIQGGEDSIVHYDSLGRVSWTENILGHFDHTYDGVTPRLTQTVAQATGQTSNYTYFGNNHDRRLQTLENLAGGGANLSKFDYTYDAEGQIMSWNRQLGTTTSGRWFQYDNARQLLYSRNASSPILATEVNGYVYDYTGNRTTDSKTAPQSQTIQHTYTINELNQIDSFETQAGPSSPGPVDLTYDLAGNLIDDGEGKTYEWDAASRLIAVNYTAIAKRSEFTYDGLGRRVKIVEKAGSTVTSTKQFVWVGNTIAQERDENNAIKRHYFAEGELRGVPGTRTAKYYYYKRDHLGSIREVTSGGGVVEARYDYDPYGQRTKLSGTLDVDFGYTGHYHHAPSGLNLTLYRGYNPAVGRWISKDPIGEEGGINLYAYVLDDPINFSDPFGLDRAGDGVPTVGWQRHTNYLTFTLRCPPGKMVANVRVNYPQLATKLYPTLGSVILGDQDPSAPNPRSAPNANCRGLPVTVTAYMRTRYTDYKMAGFGSYYNVLMYQEYVYITYDCVCCR